MSRRFLWIITIVILLSAAYFRMRNYIRYTLIKNHRPATTQLHHIEHNDEGYFEVDVYQIEREWNCASVGLYNDMFDDEIIVFKIPHDKVRFENITQKPIGSDTKQEFNCWFNTQYFLKNYQPCEGWKDGQLEFSTNHIDHTSVSISKQGRVIFAQNIGKIEAEHLFECRHTHRSNQKQPLFMDNLNYRSYMAITPQFVYYAVGNDNSLISCRDVDALMTLFPIDSWIITDGGTSIDYFFQGTHKNYAFSSIPMRSLIEGWNSPYYMGIQSMK